MTLASIKPMVDKAIEEHHKGVKAEIEETEKLVIDAIRDLEYATGNRVHLLNLNLKNVRNLVVGSIAINGILLGTIIVLLLVDLLPK